jgi:hypothetical protein
MGDQYSALRVKLSDIVEGLEFQSDECLSYLNTATGEVVSREQGDAGGNSESPVEWPVLFTCHSNPEKPPYACQIATRHLSR